MNGLRSENIALGVLLLLALGIVYVPAAIVVVGLVRIMVLRILSVFQIRRVSEKSLSQFYAAAKAAIKIGSVNELARLIYYNPRGGIILVMFLVPVSLVLCVVIALVGAAVITLASRL